MSIIDQIATSQGRKDDKLNIELAKKLAETQDNKSIKELTEHLQDQDPNIASDCIKVLYELGYIKPELIADYVDNFIDLLSSKNNRLVWGGMIATQTVTKLKPENVWKRVGEIIGAYDKGSVITMDRAIMALSDLSSMDKEYEQRIFPLLLEYLDKVRIKSIPMYAESVFVAVNNKNKQKYIELLNSKLSVLDGSKKSRVQKLLNKAEKL